MARLLSACLLGASALILGGGVVAAQTPTPEPSATSTATPTGTPGTPTPATGTAEPTVAETVTPTTVVPQDTMLVTARLPVPAGTEATFDLLSEGGTIEVCATALTTGPEEDGASLLGATLPSECGLGIVACPDGNGPCVRLSVGDDIYAFFAFAAGSELDLGTLAPRIVGPSIIGPETGHGPVSGEGTPVMLAAAVVAALAGVLALASGLREASRRARSVS